MSQAPWRAHLDISDPGMIEGTCSDCGKVLYSTTTATSCHSAGKWMRSTNPNHYIWAKHPKGAYVEWDPEGQIDE